MASVELKAYVRRRATPEDKRVKLLGVPKQRRTLHDESRPCAEGAQRRILDGLSSEDQKALLRLLTRLVELNAHIGPTAPEQEKLQVVVALRGDSGAAANARVRSRNLSRRHSRLAKFV